MRGSRLTILANNYISLSEGKWNEMTTLNSEGNSEYETKTRALKLAVFMYYGVLRQCKKNNNSKNGKAAAVSKVL